MLSEKHAQLVRQNDSLVKIITNSNQNLLTLAENYRRISRDLADRNQEFTALKRDVTRDWEKLEKLGFSPNTLVRQEELAVIYQVNDSTDFRKGIETKGLKLQPFSIGRMEDVSTEKMKVQNERLLQKNQEYMVAIDSNLQIIKNHEVLVSKLNDAVQKMEELSTVLVKNKKALKQKYELLHTKRLELELKKEEEEIAAENARLEKLAKTAPKKKNEKTIKLVPPEIIDREWDYPYGRDVDDNSVPPKEPVYHSYDPAPIVREEKIALQEPVILEIVEEPAEFPGGIDALKKYLADHIVYPESAKEAGISGKVYLKFVVSNQGNISNVKVMRGIAGCPECDREATRVVKAMPKWTPGKNSGKTVNMYYNLPIIFKLSDK